MPFAFEPSKDKRENVEVVPIDRFIVPEESKGKFLEEIRKSAASLGRSGICKARMNNTRDLQQSRHFELARESVLLSWRKRVRVERTDDIRDAVHRF
jgi:hypothetical protein